MIRGVDVSSWQGDIKWSSVFEDGIEVAVIRSTVFGTRYAPSYVDPKFTDNWNNAKEGGLRVSTYYVHRPDLDAEMQVENFLNAINGLSPDLPFVFDVELDGRGMGASAITAHLWRCLDIFEQEQDKPIIYTGAWFWNPNILRDDNWKQYKLWAASYTPEARIPLDWDDWYIWQHTNKGRVAGILGNVDLNRIKPAKDDKLIFTLTQESPYYSGLGIDTRIRGTFKAGQQIRGMRAWVETNKGWVKVSNNIT